MSSHWLTRRCTARYMLPWRTDAFDMHGSVIFLARLISVDRNRPNGQLLRDSLVHWTAIETQPSPA